MKFKVKSYWFVFIAFVAISNANAQNNELLSLQELCAQPYYNPRTDTLKDKSKVFSYSDKIETHFSSITYGKKDTFDINPINYPNIQDLNISGMFMPMPEQIFKFKNLQILQIHSRGYSQTNYVTPLNFPDDFYNLSNLKILIVTSSKSRAMFDYRLEKLQNLEVLVLNGASVIPEMFYKLPKLKIFIINGYRYIFEDGIFIDEPYNPKDLESKSDSIIENCILSNITYDVSVSMSKLLSIKFDEPEKYWLQNGNVELSHLPNTNSSDIYYFKEKYKKDWRERLKNLKPPYISKLIIGEMKDGQPFGKWSILEDENSQNFTNHEYKNGKLFRSWIKDDAESWNRSFNVEYSDDGKYSTYTCTAVYKDFCFMKYNEGSAMYGYIQDSTGILRDFNYYNKTKYNTKFLNKYRVAELHSKQKIKDEVFLNCEECVYVNAKLNGMQKIYNDAKTAFVEIPFKDDEALTGKYKITYTNKTIDNYIIID